MLDKMIKCSSSFLFAQEDLINLTVKTLKKIIFSGI